jgi:hypothetical protein
MNKNYVKGVWWWLLILTFIYEKFYLYSSFPHYCAIK